MGVVFRARDTKLLRDVALKVLPEHLADDPDRLSRFQREAQLLASMNHPNIAQIYGLEQAGRGGCIVMEMVEGETLLAKLKNGPLPLDEAIHIAKQVAAALAAAHERGVVHRDLKPANIMITPDGTVKVLDFGLAKTVGGEWNSDLTAMPTRVSGSVAGLVVGTAGYLSPEQARGKEVDARTDIWSFGCVLYEMLTARLAFQGETATDMIARIVSGQPDLNLLPANTPASIRFLLEAALNKDVQQRLQHIGDVRLFFDERFFPSAAASAAATPEKKRRRVIALTATFAAGVLAALIPALFYMTSADTPSTGARLHVEIPLPGVLGVISISPDGQSIAYIGQPQNEERGIWIRPTGDDTAHRLPGTESANTGLFWSPDSRYLGFVADGKLKKIDVLGGAPQFLCDFVGNARGFTWNSRGVILFAKSPENVILQVSDSGGEPRPLTTLDESRKQILHAGPVFLPDGDRFFYLVAAPAAEDSGIFVRSLDSGEPKRLMPLPPQINSLAYASPGYFVYSNGPVVMAQRFDLSRLELEGKPMPVADGAQNANFTVSNSGLLLFRKGSTAPPNDQLVWFDRTGKRVGEVGPEGNYGAVELSPKGDRAAVDMTANGNRDIWVIDIARGVPARITHDAAADWSPSWSSDGARLVFASSRSGGNDIYQKSSSSIGNDELVFNSEKNEIPVHSSPDGRYIVFSRPRPQGGTPGNDTWVLDLAGEKKEMPFVESPFDKIHARISPNGRWVAYATNDSGMYQIVVQSFPDPNGGKWQITAQGGVEPKWRRDGRELYYLALDGKLMAVPTRTDLTFEAGTPVELFATPLTVARPTPSRDRRYDVSADGRFLILAPTGARTTATVVGLVNWAAPLEKQ